MNISIFRYSDSTLVCGFVFSQTSVHHRVIGLHGRTCRLDNIGLVYLDLIQACALSYARTCRLDNIGLVY